MTDQRLISRQERVLRALGIEGLAGADPVAFGNAARVLVADLCQVAVALGLSPIVLLVAAHSHHAGAADERLAAQLRATVGEEARGVLAQLRLELERYAAAVAREGDRLTVEERRAALDGEEAAGEIAVLARWAAEMMMPLLAE